MLPRYITYILLICIISFSLISTPLHARGIDVREQPLTTISYPAVNFSIYPYYLVAESNDTVMYVLLRWFPFTPVYQWWTRQGDTVYVYYEYKNTWWGIDIYARVTYRFADPGIAKISIDFHSNKPATKSLPYMLYMISYAEEKGLGKKIAMHMRRHGHMRGWDKPTTAVAGRVFFDWSDMIRSGMEPVLNVTTNYASIMALWVNWTSTTKTIDPVVGVLNGTETFTVNETALYQSGSGTFTIPTTATTYANANSGVTIGTTSISFSYTVSGFIYVNAYVQYTLGTPINNVYKIVMHSGGTVNADTGGTHYINAFWGDGTSSSGSIPAGVGNGAVTISEPKTLTGVKVGVSGYLYVYTVPGTWTVDTTVTYYTAGYVRQAVNVTEYYTVYSTSNATYSYLISVPWINTTTYPLLNNPAFNLTVPSGYDLQALDNSTGAIISYSVVDNGVNKTYVFTINNTLAPLKFWVNFTAWNSITYISVTDRAGENYTYYPYNYNVTIHARLIDPFGTPINGTNVTYTVYINNVSSTLNVTTDQNGWANLTITTPNEDAEITIQAQYNGSYVGVKNITIYTTGVEITTNVSSLPDPMIPGKTYVITGEAKLTINNQTIPLMINGSGQIYYLTPTVGGNQTFTFQLWAYYQAVNVTRYTSVSRIVGDYINTSTVDVEFIGGKPVIRGTSMYTHRQVEYLEMNWTGNGTIAYGPSISWILDKALKLNIYRPQIWTAGYIMAWADNKTMSIIVDNTHHKITFILHGPCLLKVWVGDLGVPRQVIYDYRVTTNWWYNATEQVIYIPVNGTVVTLDYSNLLGTTGAGGGGGGIVIPQANAEPVKPVVPHVSSGSPSNTSVFGTGLAIIFLSVLGIIVYSRVSRKNKISYLWREQIKRKTKIKWKKKDKWWD